MHLSRFSKSTAIAFLLFFHHSSQAQTWFTHATTVAGGHGSGSAANQLNDPDGLWVDGAGNVYVADYNNSRVQKWAPGATAGTIVAGSTTYGNQANELDGPANIYMDASGNLYIVDDDNDRVQKWASGATTGTTVAGGGSMGGPALDQLNFPDDVFLDASGNVYVSDGANERIIKWAPGATTGVVAAGGAGMGATLHQLAGPSGLYIKGNYMYISDYNNSRVLKWAFGDTAGVVVAGGNGAGAAANQLSGPEGVVMDAAGNLYICDAANNRIQMWASGATSGVTIAGGYGAGASDSQLSSPNYIRLDDSMNLYVCDGANQRVQKFGLKSHGTTGLQNISPVFSAVQLYPNPSRGNFYVQGKIDISCTDDLSVTITDINGRTVYRSNFPIAKGTFHIPISMGDNFPNGIYQLQLNVGMQKTSLKFTLDK